MSSLYIETSAVLAWMLGEKRGAAVQEALGAATLVVTSKLTILEAERALSRAERDSVVTEGEAQRLRGLLRRVSDTWTRMSLCEEVLERAARPFPVEPVRTLDALHLATALAFTKSCPDLRVVSFDQRVLANATALGVA